MGAVHRGPSELFGRSFTTVGGWPGFEAGSSLLPRMIARVPCTDDCQGAMHRGGAAGAWHRGAAEGLNVVRAEAVVNADVWGIAAECGGGLLVGDQQVGIAKKTNVAEAGI